MVEKLVTITAKQAWEFLKPRHYAGRKPNICVAFGWEINGKIVAVCTFGKPASPSLCDGICGKQYRNQVFELNRLCRIEELDLPLSQFVSACLRNLREKDWIIVSYSDTGMHHNGYIYQACNFIYTGKTKERTDKWTESGKHSRHYSNEAQGEYRKVRTAKHRYVYFATRSKTKRKELLQALNYPICPYPKGENQNYILGEYQKDKIVPSKKSGDSQKIEQEQFKIHLWDN